jgi:hypothetical protein
LGGLLTAGCLLPALAWGQDNAAPAPAVLDAKPIGKVISLTGSARIEHPAAIIVQANLPTGDVGTKIGDLVYRGDVVQTGVDGILSITFTDGTTFNATHNARMAIDEFVYDPNSNSNSALISLSKGTFTFIAGAIAHKGDMRVDTPVATMGIRGTAPRVEIAEDGTTKFSTLVERHR